MAASEGMSSVPPSQRLGGGLNSQLLLLQDDALRFSCGPPQQHGDPGPKTRELSGFINDRYGQPLSQGLSEFRSDIFGDDHQLDHHQDRNNWNGGNCRTSSGDGSEEDDEDLDDEDDNDRERGIDHNKNSGEAVNGDGFSFEKSKHISSFGVGTSRGLILEEGNDSINATTIANLNDDSHEQERMDRYQSTVTIAEPEGDLYYSQYLQGQEVLGGRQKDVAIENGCGFSGRSELGESLRVCFSDPVTGALMDDAMILPCGHSFGGGGVQQILRIKACYTCSQPVSEESILPNLSLRAAIQAFQREEELHVHRSSKKRRERYEQDKGNYGDSTPMDHHHHSRGRGVQFPFVVTDRVIIKGNKRTPLRFVGREAIVTTQCLNGWYVVKTLDNAESVKLQYRSLAKVSDNPSSSKPATLPVPPKMTPNWL